MIINQNLMAVDTHKKITIINKKVAKSVEKISSGHSINRAADDAAGLSISESMRAEITAMRKTIDIEDNAINMCAIADAALDENYSMLTRITELLIQSEDGIYHDDELDSIQNEINELIENMDDIALNTKCNEVYPLSANIDGRSDKFWIQLEYKDNAGMYIDLCDATGKGLGLGSSGNRLLDVKDTKKSLQLVNNAIDKVTHDRNIFGTASMRCEAAIGYNSIYSQNLSSAESLIRDANIADAMAKFSKDQLMEQMTMPMLAQANSAPQAVLALLQQ